MDKKGENNFGTAAVVLGILSIISASINGVILGIIGLVFSLKQRKINKNQWANSGIILSVIGIILGIITFIFYIKSASNLAQYLPT